MHIEEKKKERKTPNALYLPFPEHPALFPTFKAFYFRKITFEHSFFFISTAVLTEINL